MFVCYQCCVCVLVGGMYISVLLDKVYLYIS